MPNSATDYSRNYFPAPCAVAFPHHRIQRFLELGLDVDIFVDGEIGALFVFIEAAGASRNNNDGNVSRLRDSSSER